MSRGDREQTSNTKKHCFEYNIGRSESVGWRESKEHWACWANVALPRQPHPPVMTGGQPGESTSIGQKSQHTVAPPLSASPSTSYTEKKIIIMVEQLQFLCHPSLNWPLLWLSEWPSSNLHIAVSSQSSYLWCVCVCVKHTYVLLL